VLICRRKKKKGGAILNRRPHSLGEKDLLRRRKKGERGEGGARLDREPEEKIHEHERGNGLIYIGEGARSQGQKKGGRGQGRVNLTAAREASYIR